ncbi:MAG: hypothetical protein ACMXX5_02125 [Candidatus Woesearchaeota archaeon]
MDIFVHKFISVTPRKILGKNCSEITFAGTNIKIPFLNREENSTLDSKFSINIKNIKSEIDSVKKTSRTIIIRNGEPCLQSLALKSLAEHIKQQGFFLALETYGTRPSIIRHMIENKLIDIIILKLYFPLIEPWIRKANKENLVSNHKELIKNIKETISIIKTSNINVRVNTIIVPSFIYRIGDIKKIAREIKDIRNCTYELIAFEPPNAEKEFIKIKKPTEEFMQELRDAVKKEYPMLNVK